MTNPVGKTQSTRKKRVPTAKKAVAQKPKAETTSATPKKQNTVSDSKKEPVAKSGSKTDQNLNSQNYPLHPERIWPD
jgi:hypothetical protein